MKNMKPDQPPGGFTLIEVILVIVIIGIMATVALRSMQPGVGQARVEATMQEMDLLAEAIVGDESLVEGNMSKQFGYAGDGGAMPPNLDSLAANRGSYSAWDKPHVRRTSSTKTSMAMRGHHADPTTSADSSRAPSRVSDRATPLLSVSNIHSSKGRRLHPD